MPINPNDLPKDVNGKPIYPKEKAEKFPEGTKHLPDGSKLLPSGKVIASPDAVEGPPNPNDLERDKDGKLTAKSQKIVDAYQRKTQPAPKPDKHATPKVEKPKASKEPEGKPKADAVPPAADEKAPA